MFAAAVFFSYFCRLKSKKDSRTVYFNDIPGHDDIKGLLLRQVEEGRVPHAQLFRGPVGVGKLPMAVAFARLLCCTGRQPGDADACGHCPSCIKMNKLVHPDVHFMMPVFKKESGRPPETYPQSDDFIAPWRQSFLGNPYQDLNEWLRNAGAENQQGEIYVAQASEILRKLSLQSSEGGRRIVILWMPEKMNAQCANKLLKLIEEPPAETVFLLVTEESENILPTILSRAQSIPFRPLEEGEIARALQQHYGLEGDVAASVAHTAAGSWARAQLTISTDNQESQYTDYFMQLMRLSYTRKLREMKQWSEEVARWGRAPQKHFLEYCQRMLRESFMRNFQLPELNYMNTAEEQFTSRFAPFVNEKNIFGIMDVLSDAQRDIAGNVNAKMVFFDLSLKMIMLLKQ